MSARSPLPSEGGRCSMTKRQRRHPFRHHSLVCFEEQLQKVEKVLVEGLHSGSNHFTTTPLGTSWRSHAETRCDPQLSADRQSCLCYSANTWPLLLLSQFHSLTTDINTWLFSRLSGRF